jgi:hypothetical protein
MDAYRPESWDELDETFGTVVGNGELSLIEVRLP